MSIISQAYTGADDLQQIQAATAGWIASAGFSGYLHVGDLALRLYNGMRRYNPAEIVRLWRDADGTLLGWGMVYPRWDSYEALVHPAQRGGDPEAQILDWCEAETFGWMAREGRPAVPITLEVFTDDTTRMTTLESRGYSRSGQPDVIGVRSLDEPIPDGALPAGFNIRPLEDAQEADKLVEAQNASFGWTGTVAEYQRFMRSPGYETELVAAAPDGRIAAFCYLMLDRWNKIGMIEDVGTHPDFQRKGLARALLYEGMKWMKTQGMVTAFIPYNASLSPASALYASVGFKIQHRQHYYTKHR